MERLEKVFDNRLRIRWSEASKEFHIEQKVGHGFSLGMPVSEDDDALIRARDGYHYVMSIRDGDRMPCPECGFTLRVPVRDTEDLRCGFCQLQGKTTRVVAGFWPLDDALITHLQKIDPLRGKQDEIAEAADRRNRLLVQSRENDAFAPGNAYAEEAYNRMVGIPQVGYTGREFKAA